jgi:hypothetical protein
MIRACKSIVLQKAGCSGSQLSYWETFSFLFSSYVCNMHRGTHSMYTTYHGACGAHLVTAQPYRKGELIHKIDKYQIVTKPTYQTIQIGQDLHLEELGIIASMNHSCQPNTIIDTSSLTIRAIRDIAVGEDLSFFYPSTEWEMDRPFVCLCGTPQCIRLVAGAKYLSIDVLRNYFINQHIREMITSVLTESTRLAPFAPGILDLSQPGYVPNGRA